MKTLLTGAVINAAAKIRSAATIGAVQMSGILAAGAADGLKPIFNVFVLGGAAILAFKGLATLGESQGEQSAAQKSQAYGFIGGAVILAVGGMAVIDFLFNSLSV